MTDDDAPGWAHPVDDHGDRLVNCATCGRTMPWRTFLRHGPDCGGRTEGPAGDAARRGDVKRRG